MSKNCELPNCFPTSLNNNENETFTYYPIIADKETFASCPLSYSGYSSPNADQQLILDSLGGYFINGNSGNPPLQDPSNVANSKVGYPITVTYNNHTVTTTVATHTLRKDIPGDQKNGGIIPHQFTFADAAANLVPLHNHGLEYCIGPTKKSDYIAPTNTAPDKGIWNVNTKYYWNSQFPNLSDTVTYNNKKYQLLTGCLNDSIGGYCLGYTPDTNSHIWKSISSTGGTSGGAAGGAAGGTTGGTTGGAAGGTTGGTTGGAAGGAAGGTAGGAAGGSGENNNTPPPADEEEKLWFPPYTNNQVMMAGGGVAIILILLSSK
jgi:hypothetical protein